MSIDIDLSNFRASPDYMTKQPLYPFVEVTIGGITVTDFGDDKSDTVMDFSYRRTAKQDVMNTADNTFTLTMYDDTAIEIESILYATLAETQRKTQEELDKMYDSDLSEGDLNSDDNSDNTDTNTDDSTLRSFFSDAINPSVFGSPDDTDDIKLGAKKNKKTKKKKSNKKNKSTNTNTNTEEDTDTDAENKTDTTQSDINISDKINNINIRYGWVDRNGNMIVDKVVNANFTKYSIEFEGASVILTTEGTSLDNTLLSSPSESYIKEYPASVWNGVASDIVKDVLNSTQGITYKDEDIEETESILGEDGEPKSFIRNGETATVFIKKYLCEEAKSKKTGKVGYDFIIDNGKVSYKPSNQTGTGVDVDNTTVDKDKFSDNDGGKIDSVTIDESALGASFEEEEENTINIRDDVDTSDSKIAEYAELLAYEYGTNSSMFSIGNGSPKEEYKEALIKEFPDRTNWDDFDRKGASCNVFMATVIRASRVDKDFPHTYNQQKFRLDSSGKWVDIQYIKGDKLKSGDIITYKKKDSKKCFIGIYVEKDDNKYVVCAMNGMAYGCTLGEDKVKDILDTSDKLISIYRETKYFGGNYSSNTLYKRNLDDYHKADLEEQGIVEQEEDSESEEE